jgi:hypothetical protein
MMSSGQPARTRQPSPHLDRWRFGDRSRAGLALACSPCFIWSRSGIADSFDRKRAPAHGGIDTLEITLRLWQWRVVDRVGAAAPPSAEPPPITPDMPYFAMKKARSQPLWIGCQHPTGSGSGSGTKVISLSV